MTSDLPANHRARPLTLTGERTLPGIWHENYWLRRHQAAYEVFAPMCTGARVLEAGCGEGYGAARLSAECARVVIGVDLDVPTLSHIRATYPTVFPVRANLVLLPCADASVDVVVSAQTIEHLWDQDRFVAECSRVLRPGGILVMSTPNRRTFPPGNVFHSRELDSEELADLVRPHLDIVRLAAIEHGPRLREWSDSHGDVIAAQLATPHPAWSDELSTLVRSVTVDDFTVTDSAPTSAPDMVDNSLDLLITAPRAENRSRSGSRRSRG